MNRLSMVIVAVILIMMPATVRAVENGAKAPDFKLIDSNGTMRSLSDFKGKHIVLEWVNYECPFVVKHYRSKNMQNLQKKYTKQGVIWLSINSSASGNQGYYSSEEINEIMLNAGASPTAYLIDKSGKVGRLYNAKTTPHMYIVDPNGKLIYQGAIDSIPSFDMEDVAKADNYVSNVLDDMLAGNTVEPFSTRSYGCSVKY